MGHPRKTGLVSALCGGVLSAVTLVAGVALYTVPTLTPVSAEVAMVLSATVLSLPIWAAGLIYAFYSGSLGMSTHIERVLFLGASSTLGLYIIGLVMVWSQLAPLRPIGDGVYVVATSLLLIVCSKTVLAEVRNRRMGGDS